MNHENKFCVQMCEEEMSVSYMTLTIKTQWDTFTKLLKQIDEKFEIFDEDHKGSLKEQANLFSKKTSQDYNELFFFVACNDKAIDLLTLAKNNGIIASLSKLLNCNYIILIVVSLFFYYF